MDFPQPARSCNLREGIDHAIKQCLERHAPRVLQFRIILDPRLPKEVSFEPFRLEQSLLQLLDRAAQIATRSSMALIVYEMDDTSRSILRFEIEGTELGFSLTQEASGPIRCFEPHGLSILVAEDNAINQQMAIECLRSLNHECKVVGDGWSAVEESAKTSYDVIFMDVHMPVMDGLQATREIRLLPDGHRPYIAALTAYAMPGDKARCLEAGMNDYIAKPCRAENLALILQKAALSRNGAGS